MSDEIKVGDRFELIGTVVEEFKSTGDFMVEFAIAGSPGHSVRARMWSDALLSGKRLPPVLKVGDRVVTPQDRNGWTWTIAHVWERWAWVVPFGSLADHGGYGQIRPISELEPAS